MMEGEKKGRKSGEVNKKAYVNIEIQIQEESQMSMATATMWHMIDGNGTQSSCIFKKYHASRRL